MAELEDAPWATKQPQLEDAPWAAKPSVGKDIAKTAAPSVLRGTLGLLTLPGTLADLPERTLDWAVHKIAPDSEFDKAVQGVRNAFIDKDTGQPPSFFPTYNTALQGIENKTGPLYHAQTGPGKAFEIGTEALPSLAVGGEGAIPSLLRATGAGIGGETAREGGAALKPYLPEWAQSGVEPVTQAVGSVLGGSLGPRAVTPLPLSEGRTAELNALEAQHPNFPMTAGQRANSPTTLELEARAPSMANVPAQQSQAFTQGVMERMGSQGPFNPQNVRQGENVGQELGTIRGANKMDSGNFQNFVDQINNEKRGVERVIGRGNASGINDLRKDTLAGAMNAPGQRVYNMPGMRYQYMRTRIQNDIDSAATNEEKMALSRLRDGLDNAFYNSMPADQAARLQDLERQYANYNVVRNINSTPQIRETESITPNDVFNASSKQWGTPAVNADRGDLVPYARNAERVMIPHPEVNDQGIFHTATGPLHRVGGALVGGASAAAAHLGHPTIDPLVGMIAGQEIAGPTMELLKRGAGRVISTPAAQSFLKNQIAAPKVNDPSVLLRLLMSPGS